MAITITILGASGKMGTQIHQLALKDPQLHVICIARRSKSPESDHDLMSSLACCDVAIDFTAHEATARHLEAAMQGKKPLVIGTTGHTPEMVRAIEEAAKTIPILFSPNFSFGIALCLEAAARFARALNETCSVEIIETHHIHKKDKPSGTALAFAKAIGQEIAIHSIRSGEVIGEHLIIFECGHERIELKHTAHSRDAFAAGALMGAKFLAKQPPGLYSLKDLFA